MWKFYQLYCEDNPDGQIVQYDTLSEVFAKLSLIAEALEGASPTTLQAEVFGWTDQASCDWAWDVGEMERNLLLRLTVRV